MARCRIEGLRTSALGVPLEEPFVIASGRVDVTPSVLVEVDVVDLDTGARATGLGEAATLPPVTKESPASVLGWFAALGSQLPLPADLERLEAWAAEQLLERDANGSAVPGTFRGSSAQGLFTALLDARARLSGRPARELLAGDGARAAGVLVTDVTLPIGAPEHMAALARRWRARGFSCFKVKVGKDADQDLVALERIHRAVPDATFRVDANAGFTAQEAIAVARETQRLGLAVECFEQPCGKDALDAMAEVAAALEVPVIADESFQRPEDLAVLAKEKAADGVNLKLAKLGSPEVAVACGRLARDRYGLKLMVGAMVETRLGITAAASVAAALGGVDYPDLDTALLLASDPFTGGYTMDGARLTLSAAAGLGVERAMR